MTTQEQAYINGFVKRANQYGFSNSEAIELYKQALGQVMPMASKKPVLPPRKPVNQQIKGNANDVANNPPPLKPLHPDDVY